MRHVRLCAYVVVRKSPLSSNVVIIGMQVSAYM